MIFICNGIKRFLEVKAFYAMKLLFEKCFNMYCGQHLEHFVPEIVTSFLTVFVLEWF